MVDENTVLERGPEKVESKGVGIGVGGGGWGEGSEGNKEGGGPNILNRG